MGTHTNKPTVLITGANGLLGQKLVQLLIEKDDFNIIATGRGASRLIGLDAGYLYDSMDITSEEEVFSVVEKHKPNVIIHTAAMTNVDQCESEREECWAQNVLAVQYLANVAQKHSIFLLHVSTDFIFDGAAGPYNEEAEANPISYYGESKWEAEKIVTALSTPWAIARTVLVYGITPKMSRTNIILWVKKSLEEGKNIKVVTDQFRTPTLAEDLAMGCYLIAKKQATGIFNISGEELMTPYDMAMATAAYFTLDNSLITKADATMFSQPAKRPPRTGFDISKAKTQLGYQPHSFKEGIELLASQMSLL